MSQTDPSILMCVVMRLVRDGMNSRKRMGLMGVSKGHLIVF